MKRPPVTNVANSNDNALRYLNNPPGGDTLDLTNGERS